LPFFVVFLLFVLLSGCGPLSAVVSYRIDPGYPVNRDETIHLQNLNSPVDVYFDDYGIPHITAQDTVDLARAVGFIQARYRFFQLDILRRFGKGRISELVGDQKILFSSTVEFDLAMRGWGFEKRSQIDLDSIPQFDRDVILAFTDGINQAVKKFKPIEYKILGIAPEAWEPSDTLVVTLVQCWSITHNWEQEAVRLSLALSLGLPGAEKIYPNDPLPGASTLTRSEKKGTALPPAYAPEIKEFFPWGKDARGFCPETAEGRGYVMGDLSEIRSSASNAWVVGGGLSKNGKPILSNDMHLTHFLPSLIFLQHIKSPELDVIGATMPGLPFIIGGHNGKIAWGSTSAVADVVDLRIEKPDPANPAFILNESGECELITESLIVRVRHGSDFEEREFKLRRTCNGPLLNDMYPGFLPPGAPMVAIKWELPAIQYSIGNIYKANRAQSLEELRYALMAIPIAQNIMAADIDGSIAFFSTGAVPVRSHHRGTFPAPGWLAKYQWEGWTPIDEMPSSFNPEQGFLVNTNNKVVNPYDHQPLFHVDTAPSYRYDRAVERIQAVRLHDKKTIQDIQLDNKVIRAERVWPIMLQDLEGLTDGSPTGQRALQVMKEWQYFSEADSTGALLFYFIYREAIVQALKGKTTNSVIHAFLKQRYSTNVVDLWFTNNEHFVWDNLSTTVRELREDVVQSSFREVVTRLGDELGGDVDDWRWGQFHYLHPRHLFGSKQALKFMNLEKAGLPGGLDTVWKAHFNLADDGESFKVVAGPAFRFVIDLADIENAGFCIDTGESGWPLSPHYGDLYKKWLEGELVPMVYDWKKIRSHMTRMRLVRP